MESMGLGASLWRFAKVYARAWCRELGFSTTPRASGCSSSFSGGDAAAGPMLAEQEQVQAQAQAPFAMTGKRAAVLASLGVAVPVIMVWNHAGFLLDEILFRGWNAQAVDRPVFIVGSARSGTTWVHRVLAEDSANFTAPQLWEIIFAQSVSWRVFFHKLARMDARCGGHLEKFVRYLDKRVFPGGEMHKFGLWRAEEDEWFMMNVSACQLAALIFPLIDDFSDLIYFDKSLSEKERKAIFKYYRECMQRHLYASEYLQELRIQYARRMRDKRVEDSESFTQRLGRKASSLSILASPERSAVAKDLHKHRRLRYLSKNPTFTLRMRSIFETFPDANIIVMVRDPFKAIPSMVSYIGSCWSTFASPTTKYPLKEELQSMCSLHYAYPVEVMQKYKRAARQVCILHYELCVEDLVKSFSSLYAFLGIGMSSSMAAILMDEARLSQSYSSRHHYDLMATTGHSRASFLKQHAVAFRLYPAYRSEEMNQSVIF